MTEQHPTTKNLLRGSDTKNSPYYTAITGQLPQEAIRFVGAHDPADAVVQVDATSSPSDAYDTYIESLVRKAEASSWWNEAGIEPGLIRSKTELRSPDGIGGGVNLYAVGGDTNEITTDLLAEIIHTVDTCTGGLLSRGDPSIPVALVYGVDTPLSSNPQALGIHMQGVVKIAIDTIAERAKEARVDADVLLRRILTHELAHYIDYRVGGKTGRVAQEQFDFSADKTPTDTKWGAVHSHINHKVTGESIELPHVYAKTNPAEFTAVTLDTYLLAERGAGEYERNDLSEPLRGFAAALLGRAAALATIDGPFGVPQKMTRSPIVDGKEAVMQERAAVLANVLPALSPEPLRIAVEQIEMPFF